MIYLYNTLTKNKEEFKPMNEGSVSMYHCGPTVYDYPHIGNMRAYVFADTIRRVFKWNGYKVNQVINITDVGHLVGDGDQGEDKMDIAVKKLHKTADEIAKFYTDVFFDDLKKINADTNGTIFPRATEHIAEQIKLIEKLEEKGFTYRTSDGIYFDSSKLPDYGKLMGGSEKLKWDAEFARVIPSFEKRGHLDFALWKFSPKSSHRQQEWESPWGTGFPGWHIECSAMSMKYLGNHFDIHTGGVDHIPVHHTNEIAQSEVATGEKYVNYWIHSGHVLINGEKMSKSLGNVVTLSDLEEKGINPLAYRYWLLSAKYKTLLNFTEHSIKSAQTALDKIYDAYIELDDGGSLDEGYRAKFEEYINDDLDTPRAIALVWEMLKDDSIRDEDKKATLLQFDKVLGLDIESRYKIEIPIEIIALVREREEARNKKEWSKSDELRKKLSDLGYEIKDTDNGSKISKNKK